MYVTALYVRSAVRSNIRILNLFVMRILMEWKKYGHLNFQVVIDYGPEEIGRLLNTMGILVQSGKRFSDGSIVEGLYLDCNVTLKEMKYDNSTSVLRLIIPDKNNKMPPFADYPYCLQYRTIQ